MPFQSERVIVGCCDLSIELASCERLRRRVQWLLCHPKIVGHHEEVIVRCVAVVDGCRVEVLWYRNPQKIEKKELKKGEQPTTDIPTIIIGRGVHESE